MAHELSSNEIASLVLEAIRNPKARERICKRQHITEHEFEKLQTRFIRAGTKALKPEVSKRGRSYTHEEKLDIVFAGLRHDENRDRLLDEHHVSPKTYHRWRDQFTEAGKLAFKRGLPRPNPVMTLVVVTLLLVMGIVIFVVMSTKGASCLYDIRATSPEQEQIRKIDINTLQIYSATASEWYAGCCYEDNTYRSPDSHEFNAVDIQLCPACNAEIPVPVIPNALRAQDPAAVTEIIMKQVCPKCHAKIGKQLAEAD